MRIPFDIKHRDKIESGEYKVVTRDGRSARILCWDRKNVNYPIVTLVTNGDYEFFYDYTLEGKNSVSEENAHDLFIVTPEPEMSEFEMALRNAMSDTVALSEDREDYEVSEICDKQAKRYSAELLDLAKSQLLQSGELLTQEHHEKLMETLNKAHEEELEKAYKNADEVQYRKGREDALKELPRWRNVEADKRYVGCVARYMDVNGDWNYCMSSGKLSDDCQYISIAALEKLPKEEDHE